MFSAPRKILFFLIMLLSLSPLQMAVATNSDADLGDVRRLPEFTSHRGILKATLVAQDTPVTLGKVAVSAMTFNGEYGGPVLRVHPGDTLKIRLVNRLKLPINLHFHGYHGSPLAHGDNVLVVVLPGESFDYRLTIPTDQPPGLYWYHTHIHGISEEEVGRGLSGAWIVEGVDQRAPEVAGLRARLMVLKSFSVDRPDDPEVKRLHGVIQSINGGTETLIAAKGGQQEFWRVSNQSANDYFHLSAKGLSFRVLALDGNVVAQETGVDTLDLPPGGRMEVMVDMPKEGGHFTLQSGATPTGLGRNLKTSRTLADIAVSPADGVTSAPAPAAFLSHSPLLPDLRQVGLTGKRDIVFSQVPGEEVYQIDGKTYAHDRMDQRIALGSIEEWTVHNTTQDMHVFHIHQIHFQVVAINDKPVDGLLYLDTVRVPEGGTVTLRMAFTDPKIVGRFVYHCHVLKHEDKGMMANIEIYDPKAPARSDVLGKHSGIFGLPICWPKKTAA